jgi:hypothetical protein
LEIKLDKIVCQNIDGYQNSKRSLPFWIAKIIFSYESSIFDKAIITAIEAEAYKLAGAVNPGAANNAVDKRTEARLLSNSMAGVLSEYAWKTFLNCASVDLLVQETPFVDAMTQIDLVTVNRQDNLLLEVRSSFPRNGVEFAICHEMYEFDILGPYCNDYKPSEVQKNYYLRALYHVSSPEEFLQAIKKNHFICHLTGGASWEMMMDDDIAINKTLIPEDTVGKVDKASDYRVIPFNKALDVVEVFKLLKLPN